MLIAFAQGAIAYICLSTPLWEFHLQKIAIRAESVLEEHFLLPYGSFYVYVYAKLLK